jgi:outer membrane protein assembly factor BamA
MTTEVMMTILMTRQIRSGILCLAVVVGLMFSVVTHGQDKLGDSKIDPSKIDPRWSKTSQERESRLDLAQREKYRVGHIFFAGNKYTRDRVVRQRLVRGFTEGDIFDRRALDKSLRRISKVKQIYPVAIENVEVRLDEKEKYADFVINLREKKD